MNIGSLLYFITGVLLIGISWIFYKAIDGILRKTMVSVFFTVGVGILFRGIYFLLPVDFRLQHIDLFNFIIIVPVCVTSAFGFFYLYFKFYLVDKNISNKMTTDIENKAREKDNTKREVENVERTKENNERETELDAIEERIKTE